MRRVTAWFGLAFMIWSMAGMGLFYFWSSTSAKRSLEERIAAGEPLERWIITDSEYEELGVQDGEFWWNERMYDVVSVERLAEGRVALQVFDDSYETGLAKLGRKLLRRKVDESQDPPAGLANWLSLHATLSSGCSTVIAVFWMEQTVPSANFFFKEARWSQCPENPPEGWSAQIVS
ncbi:MAG: hypothetical protein ACO3PE_00325 [Schleiferiaceae bacterium]